MGSDSLARLLAARGAILDETLGTVAAFQDLAVEVGLATGPGALQPLGHLGRLRVTGTDRLDLLGRLVTQRIDDLDVGGGLEAVMVTPKGRILGLIAILKRERELLLLTAEGQASSVAANIERYTVADDAVVETLSATTEIIGLLGPLARSIFESTTGFPLAERPVWSQAIVEIAGLEGIWVVLPDGRSGLTPKTRLALVIPREGALRVWDELLAQARATGAGPVGRRIAELFRIEDGVPGADRELSERYNPLEVGLRAAICFDKGCYVGQEVIARLHAYAKVRRRLVGVRIDQAPASLLSDSPSPPAPIGLILDRGEEVGHLTSSSRTVDRTGALGLAVVRADRARPGRRQHLGLASEEVEAELVELPFKPRSNRPASLGGAGEETSP